MELYDLTELLGVLRVTKELPKFWLQYFPNERTFNTESIAMDEVSEDLRRMAPFVAPNVQGRVQRQRGFQTVNYRPAYVKPKDVVDPNNNMFTRRAGESLATGDLSPQQRWDATVAQLVASQRVKIDNRLEWMAAKVIQDGAVTIDGVDYPKVTVDFNRDPRLTRVLTGTARWNSTAANPLADIKAANRQSNDVCGATGFSLIFGSDAFDSFSAWILANKLQLVNNDYRGSRTEIALITEGLEGVEYAGRVQGLQGGAGFDCWIYSAKVTLEDDTQEPLLASNRVIGVSSMVLGTQCFGAIRDKRAGLTAIRYFPKMWDVEDPSLTYIMTQSAPLLVPNNINATWSLTVQ